MKMDVLVSLFLFIILIAGAVLFWCLYKLYDGGVPDSIKRVVGLALFILMIYFVVSPSFKNTILHKSALHGLAAGLLYLILFVIPRLAKKTSKAIKTKAKESKLAPFKIEIVNDEKYINAKKADRITFLNSLRKQMIAELAKQQRMQDKLNAVPTDVAKYIKAKDSSSLKKYKLNLENKLMAIEELIRSEKKAK